MKKIIFLITVFFSGVVSVCFAAQPIRTQPFSEQVKTLLVRLTSNWEASPILELQGNDAIDIRFDVLGSAPGYYRYSVTHCNADWTPSALLPSEYLNGLQNNYITDYVQSFNTTMDYIHYQLFIPNNEVQLKVSGNYVLQVWDEQDHLLLNACFSVVDPRASVRMQASSVTDKGVNNYYQAVSFEILYGDEIRVPLQDLKVYVQQNRRFDNEAALLKPLSVQNRKAIYDHNPALIFDGGNEYRSFEMTTTKWNGWGIETVEYYAPYYHTILKPGYRRGDRSYSYNEDLNGRFYIRRNDADDSNTEADYEIVHFYIPCDQPFTEKVYILSDAFYNLLNADSQMEYSATDKGYVKTVLLKEGYYNFLYVTQKGNATAASTALLEGNYYETENEYCLMVYFRPLGGRYDQLIAVQTLEYK
ncbi:MAG: DUF5103 domain-containing protein [Dysgonamonadaceae bacterium]|jgi:hypothetical protein|nr:DUF5103 domain-containing protein [Dysgonamonadaceae bacterium]